MYSCQSGVRRFFLKKRNISLSFSKSAVDYDSENGDDDTGDVEGAATSDRDNNQIEQRHDVASTTQSPPTNQNENIRENIAIGSRSDLTDSNNEGAVATLDSSGAHIDSQPKVDCAVNNGGCEQNCAVAQNELTGQHVIVCSCAEGYALDIDGIHCIGKYLLNELGQPSLCTKNRA